MHSDENPTAAPGEDDVPVGTASGRLGPSPERAVLSIGNVAKMFGLSQLVLRYYELRGLIVRRHRIGRISVYGWADCDRIAFIIKCRRAGLALSEVAQVVAAVDREDDAVVQEACKKLIRRLDERRNVLEVALAELAHTCSLLSAKAPNPGNCSNRD